MNTATSPTTNTVHTTENTSDINRAIDVVVRAFESDPIVRWLFPVDETYHSIFSQFVRAYASKAIETRKIHYLSGFEGAAFWQAPGEHSEEEAVMAILQENLHGDHLEEALTLFEKIEPYHPEQPHWYLPILGVDPVCQSCGLGSQLIERQLAHCDQEGLPIFLESSNRANLSFYERHGFQLMDEVRVNQSPGLFPMIREARS